MRCEYFDGCQVYKNGGEVACKIHFCNDTCPPIPSTASATGTTVTATTAGNIGTMINAPAKKKPVRHSLGEGGGKNNADNSPGRMEQPGDCTDSGKQPTRTKGRRSKSEA